MPEEEFDTSQSDARTATQRVSELSFELKGEQGKVIALFNMTTKLTERIENASKAFSKLNVEMRLLNEEVARLTKLVEDKVSKEAENAAAQTENS